MISISPILFAEFEKLRLDLIEAYNRKGMKASGAWEDNLENVSRENVGELKGLKYTQQLEAGRPPTTSSTAGQPRLSEIIEQWIVDKGISARIEGDISIKSLAFVIARKIHREGWDRRDHGGIELITEVVTQERIDSIVEACGNFYSKEFVSEILILLKDDKLFNSVA